MAVKKYDGDQCLVDGCMGTLEIKLDGECLCHIYPPCHAHDTAHLVCSECGHDDRDEIEEKEGE